MHGGVLVNRGSSGQQGHPALCFPQAWISLSSWAGVGARTAQDVGLRAGDWGLAVHVDLAKTGPCFSVDGVFLPMYETGGGVYQAPPPSVREDRTDGLCPCTP